MPTGIVPVGIKINVSYNFGGHMTNQDLVEESGIVNNNYHTVHDDFTRDMSRLASVWVKVHRASCSKHDCEYDVTPWLSLVCPECEQETDHQPLPF